MSADAILRDAMSSVPQAVAAGVVDMASGTLPGVRTVESRGLHRRPHAVPRSRPEDGKPSTPAVPRAAAEFHWVLEGLLAGSARPGLLNTAAEDLGYFASQGIRIVVTLTEEALAEPLEDYGLEGIHFPIDDMSTPIPRRALGLCRAVSARIERGEPVVLHCNAGLGRTGTMLAATLIARGREPAAAIRQVRRVCSSYIQTASQEVFLTRLGRLVAEEAGLGEPSVDEPPPR